MFKKGDKIHSNVYGSGQIKDVHPAGHYPLIASFVNDKEFFRSFTTEGYEHNDSNDSYITKNTFAFNQEIIEAIKNNKPVWYSEDNGKTWWKYYPTLSSFSLKNCLNCKWTTINPHPTITKTLTMYANIYNTGLCCTYPTKEEATQKADYDCLHIAIKLTGTYEEGENN